MKIRRSNTLSIGIGDKHYIVQNFLFNEKFSCNLKTLDVLSALSDWQTIENAITLFKDYSSESVRDTLIVLLEHKALIVEGSAEADMDSRYSEQWEWGRIAGFYHYSMRFTEHVTYDGGYQWLEERGEQKPSPPLYIRHHDEGIKLPQFGTNTETGNVFDVMKERRSDRYFSDTQISKQSLADCLYAGLGVTGEVDEEIYGKLPLTMTPSGGARNPYELFVLVKRVEGLDEGAYHYSGYDHSLKWHNKFEDNILWLLGKQIWPPESAAIIVLVANFPRTSWKYAHPHAYKSVLIESGSIVQNILLAATAHQLTACPTGALHVIPMERQLKLDPITQAPFMVVCIGNPDPKNSSNISTSNKSL